MKLTSLSEVIWQFYDGGRPSATSQTLEKDDIEQMCLMALGDRLKFRIYDVRKLDSNDRTDSYAGMIGRVVYKLGEANYKGRRTAETTQEVLRLPRNADLININLVASNCSKDVSGLLTQVQPAEENFYINDNELKRYMFYVQKGSNIDTYNVPDCVDEIEVERIFTNENLDIPLDIAFDVSNAVLGISLKVRGFNPLEDNAMDGSKNQLRYQLEQQNKKV